MNKTNYLAAALVTLSSLTGCKNTEDDHSHRLLVDAGEVIKDCRTAVANKIFTDDQRMIICEKTVLGEPTKGSIILTKRLPCESIVSQTEKQVDNLLHSHKCFAPNIQGWPNGNHGKVFNP